MSSRMPVGKQVVGSFGSISSAAPKHARPHQQWSELGICRLVGIAISWFHSAGSPGVAHI